MSKKKEEEEIKGSFISLLDTIHIIYFDSQIQYRPNTKYIPEETDDSEINSKLQKSKSKWK